MTSSRWRHDRVRCDYSGPLVTERADTVPMSTWTRWMDIDSRSDLVVSLARLAIWSQVSIGSGLSRRSCPVSMRRLVRLGDRTCP